MNKYIDYIWKPSLVSGVLCVLYFLLFYSLGDTLFSGAMGFDMLIPLPFCAISLYYYKASNNGELRFWEGLILSSLVVYTSLLVLSFYLGVHLSVDSTYLAESIAAKEQEIITNKAQYVRLGVTEEELNYQLVHIKETTVGVIISSKIMWFSFIGFLYTIILSIIFRK